MRKYRFFYHFYKQKKKMSVHYRGVCNIVDDIMCFAPCNTKWNKTQPNLVMEGFSSKVEIIDNHAYIY